MPMETRTDSVRSYRTRFQRDEDPISEGGLWLNGARDGIDWADVIVRNGVAYGAVTRMQAAEHRIEQGNLASADPDAAPEGDYDDPTALLSGAWGKNQHAKGTVFSKNPTEEYFQEVEIRLRSTITPHRCTGYEIFFRCLKTQDGYAAIVRWDGKIGDLPLPAKPSGPEYGVEDGDVIEASIAGDVIRGYVNGVQKISAVD